MRIGFVIGSPKIGGAESQVRLLATHAERAGHEACIWFLERRARRSVAASLDFSALGHSYLGNGPGRGWWSRLNFRRQVAAFRPDVVLAFNLEAMEFAARAIPADSGVKVLGSVRGLGFEGDSRLTRRLASAAGLVSMLTCNSPAIARGLVAAGVASEDAVRLLPNVVVAGQRSGRAVSGSTKVLFAGNLIEVKQPEMFVRACLKAMETVPDLRVTIAGDGPLMPAVRRAIGDARDRFELLGHVRPEAIPYGDASVVVSSSRREGCSNVLLEAMAHGVPVVATRAGGNVDLVTDSGAGVLVDVDDDEGLACELIQICQDPERRVSLGASGRAYIERTHAPERVIGVLENVLAEVARGN